MNTNRNMLHINIQESSTYNKRNQELVLEISTGPGIFTQSDTCYIQALALQILHKVHVTSVKLLPKDEHQFMNTHAELIKVH